jgi:hypothetical protein
MLSSNKGVVLLMKHSVISELFYHSLMKHSYKIYIHPKYKHQYQIVIRMESLLELLLVFHNLHNSCYMV